MIKKTENSKMYNVGIFLIFIFIILLFLGYKDDSQNKREKSFINNKYLNLKEISDIYLKNYKKDFEGQMNFLFEKITYEKLGDEEYRNLLVQSFDEFKKYNINIKWIYLGYDENEILIDKLWEKPDNYSIKTRPWYIQGIKNEGIFWGEPYLGPTTKKVVVTLTKQLKDKTGNVKGVFAIDADLDGLSEVMGSLEFNQENFIYDTNYKIIAHSNPIYLNKDLKDSDFLKKIENNDKTYFYDSQKNAYVFFKNNFGWTLVSKIPNNKLKELKLNSIYLYLTVFLMLAFSHILYMIKNKDKTLFLIDILKAIQNREDLEGVFPEKRNPSEDAVIVELHNIQKIVEELEKEILRDEQTGLYNEIFLNNYGKKFLENGQKILVIKYLNLSEIKNNYGKNVVELVLKRGAMTLNAMKEADECALRLDKDTLAVILNSGDYNKRAHYIVNEILNYKWKLHNINLSIVPTLMNFEEYQKKDE